MAGSNSLSSCKTQENTASAQRSRHSCVTGGVQKPSSSIGLISSSVPSTAGTSLPVSVWSTQPIIAAETIPARHRQSNQTNHLCKNFFMIFSPCVQTPPGHRMNGPGARLTVPSLPPSPCTVPWKPYMSLTHRPSAYLSW